VLYFFSDVLLAEPSPRASGSVESVQVASLPQRLSIRLERIAVPPVDSPGSPPSPLPGLAEPVASPPVDDDPIDDFPSPVHSSSDSSPDAPEPFDRDHSPDVSGVPRHSPPPNKFPTRSRSPTPPVRTRSPSPKSPTPPVRARSLTPPVSDKSPTSPVKARSPTPPVRARSPTPPVRARSPTPPVRARSPTPPVRARSPSSDDDIEVVHADVVQRHYLVVTLLDSDDPASPQSPSSPDPVSSGLALPVADHVESLHPSIPESDVKPDLKPSHTIPIPELPSFPENQVDVPEQKPKPVPIPTRSNQDSSPIPRSRVEVVLVPPPPIVELADDSMVEEDVADPCDFDVFPLVVHEEASDVGKEASP